MNLSEKIVRSWWVIISLISFLNGFGFVYIGFRTKNLNWVLEGLIYEIPWIFMTAYVDTKIFGAYVAVAILLQLISFVRSIWVDMKYLDMLERHI